MYLRYMSTHSGVLCSSVYWIPLHGSDDPRRGHLSASDWIRLRVLTLDSIRWAYRKTSSMSWGRDSFEYSLDNIKLDVDTLGVVNISMLARRLRKAPLAQCLGSRLITTYTTYRIYIYSFNVVMYKRLDAVYWNYWLVPRRNLAHRQWMTTQYHTVICHYWLVSLYHFVKGGPFTGVFTGNR